VQIDSDKIKEDEIVEIQLRLKVYKSNWDRFQATLSNKHIEHLEKYINDSGAAVATPEESASIVGVRTTFELF
jgi:hypothetical protein